MTTIANLTNVNKTFHWLWTQGRQIIVNWCGLYWISINLCPITLSIISIANFKCDYLHKLVQ